ncbi:MAG: SurA N-terminal domain-containing protein [Deltaproteobacteria bacterium]|nr:SurA N-terminal domain-containing protein [Deltaproteobacteria bacterium]
MRRKFRMDAVRALKRAGQGVGLAAFALIVVLLAPMTAGAEVVDRIVAVINDSIITLSELNAATAAALEGVGGERPGDKKAFEVKGQVLDTLIEQKLVKQAADKAGIEVSEREIDNAVDDVKKQNGLTKETLLVALAQSGLTYRGYREQLKEQIRQAKFISKEFRSKINVEDAEIDEYYRRNQDGFLSPQTYRLNMIFLPLVDERAMNQKLGMILEGLDKGEEFKTLARLYSEGPNADKGGDMGMVKAHELDHAVADAAAPLEINGISKPIQTPSGIYVIQLLERPARVPMPLAEVKDAIKDRLFKKMMDDRFRFWLEETKRFAHIETRL